MPKPRLPLLIASAVALMTLSIPTAALAQPFTPAATAAVRAVSAKTLLHRLVVKKEAHASTYDRAKFKSWIDADHDGEDTRAEVLKAESLEAVTENSSHTVKTGKWVSRYDGVTVTIASKLDIDHLVPLEEAWVSGAAGWTSAKREAYANDLGYAADLIAVTKHANRSKGDEKPNAYLPPKTSYRCTYVKNYIAVKYRWKLSVNASEKRALFKDLTTYCTSLTVRKPLAPNVTALAGTTKTPTSKPSATPTPTPTPTPSVISTSAPAPTLTTPAPMPSAVTISSPPTPVYANCAAAQAAGVTPIYYGQPGYSTNLDSDGDGTACEDDTPVYSPPPAPSGASAICNDGSYSYSAHRSGTCSGHGGVRTWL